MRRFGKALEQLAEVCDSDESLLSTCVTLNPQFRHTSRSIEGGLLEMTGGAPRKHYDLSWDGLQIAERKKKEFTLRTQDTSEIRFRGAAKQEVPGFLDAVEANAG